MLCGQSVIQIRFHPDMHKIGFGLTVWTKLVIQNGRISVTREKDTENLNIRKSVLMCGSRWKAINWHLKREASPFKSAARVKAPQFSIRRQPLYSSLLCIDTMRCNMVAHCFDAYIRKIFIFLFFCPLLTWVKCRPCIYRLYIYIYSGMQNVKIACHCI